MNVRVLYHDHCFDGAASAAYFSRFIKDHVHPGATFRYTGLAHKPSQLFEDSLFDGDVNAIVDFKYSPHPRLTWWFDHHQSAFLSAEDAEHWRNDRSGKKLFDPGFKSCTKFIATVTRDRFGYASNGLEELVTWADIVDGAQYRNAEEAVALGAPAMKLTLVIESAKGSDIIHRIIGWMQDRPLAEIIAEPEVQELYRPLHEQHLRSAELIKRRATCEGKVIFFDVVDDGVEGYNKFIPYHLFPEATYTVSVSRSSFRTKVSVGSNPWAPKPPEHNLATICERYGGGGHPRVGAISFDTGALEAARTAAREIAEELRER